MLHPTKVSDLLDYVAKVSLLISVSYIRPSLYIYSDCESYTIINISNNIICYTQPKWVIYWSM